MKHVCNYLLCRARYVECVFVILSNERTLLHTTLNITKQFSRDLVKACVVLMREMNGRRSEDKYRTEGLLNWSDFQHTEGRKCQWISRQSC
jgi:hypothetical protein